MTDIIENRKRAAEKLWPDIVERRHATIMNFDATGNNMPDYTDDRNAILIAWKVMEYRGWGIIKLNNNYAIDLGGGYREEHIVPFDELADTIISAYLEEG